MWKFISLCILIIGLFKVRHFDITYNLLQAEATSEGSHEYYEDMASLLKARKTMSSFNAGVTVGISYVEMGLKGSKESDFLRNLTQHKSQV